MQLGKSKWRWRPVEQTELWFFEIWLVPCSLRWGYRTKRPFNMKGRSLSSATPPSLAVPQLCPPGLCTLHKRTGRCVSWCALTLLMIPDNMSQQCHNDNESLWLKKKCSLHCNIQTKVRHKSSLLLNERAQCSFKVSGKIGCCWASSCSCPAQRFGLPVCVPTQPPSAHSSASSPYSWTPPPTVSYLPKYFCCAVLSCPLLLECFAFSVPFRMQTNSLDRTKVLTSLCKRETNHGGFHGFQL